MEHRVGAQEAEAQHALVVYRLRRHVGALDLRDLGFPFEFQGYG